MKEKNWREKVDPSIREELNNLIEEVYKHKDAYRQAKNPSNAQIWCVLANISKQLFDINLKLKLFEKILKDSNQKSSHIKAVPDKEERASLMKLAANPKKRKNCCSQ